MNQANVQVQIEAVAVLRTQELRVLLAALIDNVLSTSGAVSTSMECLGSFSCQHHQVRPAACHARTSSL